MGKVNTKKSVLFVCLGNICRSPAADGIFHALVERHGVADQFHIDSAGTYGGHVGELPDSRMRRAASRRGFDLTHRSRQVKPADFDKFDLIVAMDDSNYQNLMRMAPTLEDQQKIHRMIDYCAPTSYSYIPDPYYEGAEGFEVVLDLLGKGCEELLSSLLKK